MDLAAIVDLLASIGVIAGIVFLGVELRQNNAHLAAQARYNLIVRRADMNTVLTTPHVISALHKHAAGEPLSREEETYVFSASVRFIEMWEWQYREFAAGMLRLEQLPIQSWHSWYHNETKLPLAIDKVWQARKHVYDPAFVAFIEDNVVNVEV
jgi:hypothetical protein